MILSSSKAKIRTALDRERHGLVMFQCFFYTEWSEPIFVLGDKVPHCTRIRFMVFSQCPADSLPNEELVLVATLHTIPEM